MYNEHFIYLKIFSGLYGFCNLILLCTDWVLLVRMFNIGKYEVLVFLFCYIIDRMLEMMSNAPTNAGKHVTTNIACVHSQRYTQHVVFWLAQMMLCLMMLPNTCFPPFIRPNIISGGPTNGLLILFKVLVFIINDLRFSNWWICLNFCVLHDC